MRVFVSFCSKKLSRHPSENKLKDSAEKTNLVCAMSSFKHLNFKLLVMKWFKEEDKMMNFIRLIMGRAVVLERIE